MKLGGWTSLLVIVAALDACRGSYIGAEDCGGSKQASTEPECPVCECPDADATARGGSSSQASRGGTTSSGSTTPAAGGAFQEPGEAGAGGGAPDVAGSSGAAGAAGGGAAPDPCAIDGELPTPSFYASFSDCSDETTQVEAALGRPPGSFVGIKNGAVSCADGPIGKAIDLSGGEVRFESIDYRPVDLEQDTTIMAWIRQDTEVSTVTAAFGRWFQHDQFGLSVSDGSVWSFAAVYNPDPIATDPQTNVVYKVSTTIDLNNWTHLAVVLRRGGEMRLFKNGIYVPQGSPQMLPRAFSFRMTDRPLLLGHYHDEYWDPRFDGAIDELRLYKTALSDLEVAAVASLHCQ